MEIITDIEHFQKEKYPKLVLTLGNFDGIHLGHLDILKRVSERAREIGGVSAVLTFKEHPQRVLNQFAAKMTSPAALLGGKENPPILTSLIHKLHLLKEAIDICFLIDFTVEFSKKSPEEFVRDILVGSLGVKEIYLGFNARFGCGRSGNSQLMKRLAPKCGFLFHEVPPLQVNGKVVSSSLIRSLVQEGRIAEANEFLGRLYSFFGTVVQGSGRGKELGFPTANLDVQSEAMPPDGVYAVWVNLWDYRLVEGMGRLELKGEVVKDRLKGLLNYGRKPTFGLSAKLVPEVHILDFNQDLIDQTVEVIVGERLRSEQTFANQDALRNQIRRDVENGEKWFQAHKINH